MQSRVRRTLIRGASAAILASFASAHHSAALVPLFNHGPGTSGGGLTTTSGELLAPGRWEFALRTDLTGFEHFSREEAEQEAIEHGEFDSVETTFVETLAVSYGVSESLQLSASTGYYYGDDFVDAEEDGLGGAESGVADPKGLTDLWLEGKWRLAHGQAGRAALLFGLKLPTGEDDEKLSNGEELEPSSQPGTGAFDGRLGVAWSRYLSPRWTVDASAAYTLRGRHDGFEVGDRADVGLAFAWRLTEDVAHRPSHSLAAELLGVWLGKDEEGSEENDDSGGTTVYAGLGWRDRFTDDVAFGIGAYVPVVQDLNGDQAETDWKIAFGFTWTL